MDHQPKMYSVVLLPDSLGHYARTRQVWEGHTFAIWSEVGKPSTIFEWVSLNYSFQGWLIQAGRQLLYRSTSGIGVAPGALKADQIKIVDTYVRLPPPSQQTSENITDIFHIVKLYRNLCVEVCITNVNNRDYKHLLYCLDYILGTTKTSVRENAAQMFESIFGHPFFLEAHSKMSLVKDSLEHLRHYYMGEQADRDIRDWKTEYDMGNRGKNYIIMIGTAIDENSILKRVYDHGQDVSESVVVRPSYEFSGVGALMLMANFCKHANDHRRKLYLRVWTIEERCAMLEHHFPNEINECFGFLWSSQVNTDWGNRNKLPNPRYMA